MTSARMESGLLLLPPFLPITVLKNAGRTTPEDATYRWWRNVEKISQKFTTVIKPGEQNYSQSYLDFKKLVMVMCVITYPNTDHLSLRRFGPRFFCIQRRECDQFAIFVPLTRDVLL